MLSESGPLDQQHGLTAGLKLVCLILCFTDALLQIPKNKPTQHLNWTKYAILQKQNCKALPKICLDALASHRSILDSDWVINILDIAYIFRA